MGGGNGIRMNIGLQQSRQMEGVKTPNLIFFKVR